MENTRRAWTPLKSELPAHSANIHIKVLVLRDDYSRDTVTGTAVAQQDQS
jgi:hypothetical protein